MEIRKISENFSQILQTTLDIIPQEVIFMDSNFNILWMNKSKKVQHPELKIGDKCYNAFGFREQCEFCMMQETKEIGHSIKNPVCLMTGQHNKRPRHINIILAQLVEDNKDIDAYLEIVDNVEALYQSNSQLERLNREYENVIYALSHDLRSPLISIEGFLRKLRKEIDKIQDREIYDHCLKRIHVNVEIMNNLVNVILDTSRINTGKLDIQEVDMKLLVNTIIEQFQLQISEKNIKITVKGEFGIIKCDRVRIHQVFANLVNNILQHCINIPNLEIEIGSDKNVYWVKDNGPGITEDFKDIIFEPFTQGEKVGSKSFGMGMNIVYKIIQKHGGEIWVESGENKGTTVFFTLGE